MRPAYALGALVAVLALLALPSPVILRTASASHAGAVECGVGGSPVSDGAIAAGEYGDNYVDASTKILVYLSCDNSTQRVLHVGLVSPWSGWAGLLVQAREPADGAFQEVRVSRDASGTVGAVDGFRNALGTFHSDAALGGTSDVVNVSGRVAGLTQVFEFSFPLNSSDGYDSQIPGAGPVSFVLEYGADADLTSEPAGQSDPQAVTLGGVDTAGTWTRLSVSHSSPAVAGQPTTLLVTLRDGNASPVAGAQIQIFVHTAFGFLELGPVVANGQGVAQATYTAFDAGSFLVGTSYEGGDGRFASVAWATVTFGLPAGGGTLRLGLTGGGGGLVLDPITAIVVTTVTGVWATYAYAAFTVRQSLRAGQDRGVVPETRVSRWRTWK